MVEQPSDVFKFSFYNLNQNSKHFMVPESSILLTNCRDQK